MIERSALCAPARATGLRVGGRLGSAAIWRRVKKTLAVRDRATVHAAGSGALGQRIRNQGLVGILWQKEATMLSRRALIGKAAVGAAAALAVGAAGAGVASARAARATTGRPADDGD